MEHVVRSVELSILATSTNCRSNILQYATSNRHVFRGPYSVPASRLRLRNLISSVGEFGSIFTWPLMADLTASSAGSLPPSEIIQTMSTICLRDERCWMPTSKLPYVDCALSASNPSLSHSSIRMSPSNIKPGPSILQNSKRLRHRNAPRLMMSPSSETCFTKRYRERMAGRSSRIRRYSLSIFSTFISKWVRSQRQELIHFGNLEKY